MLIYYWEDLRLQVFSHEFSILHYIGGVGRIDGDILQSRAAFESIMTQICQTGWDIDRLQGLAASKDFEFIE